MDASRRTTAVNAYVNGLGHYQAGRALRQPDRRASRATRCGWWWRTSSATRSTRPAARAGLAGAGGAGGHASSRSGWPSASAAAGPRRPGAQARAGGPARDRAGGGARLVRLGVASNVLSRQVEASADAFSLELTRDPAAHIALERALARAQHLRPRPARRCCTLLFGTHPTTLRADRHRRGVRRARIRLPTRCAADRARRPRAGLLRAAVGVRGRAPRGRVARRRAARRGLPRGAGRGGAGARRLLVAARAAERGRARWRRCSAAGAAGAGGRRWPRRPSTTT